jgi:hypothetical protein
LAKELLTLICVVMEDRSLGIAALASVENLVVLGENACALCYNTSDLN